MKKLLVLTCSMLLAFGLVGCTTGNKDTNSANENGIVSDMTSSHMESSGNIISDSVSMVESIISGGSQSDMNAAK